MSSTTAHKRTIQVKYSILNLIVIVWPRTHTCCIVSQMAQEAISLSQDSVLSEVSVTSAPRKRLRKCSEIKDPIRLTELQSVARANQQLQQ